MSNGYDGKERFAMGSESGTASTSSIKFKETKGVYLSRGGAAALVLLAVACIVAVGLIVAYTKPMCDTEDEGNAVATAAERKSNSSSGGSEEPEAEPTAPSRPTDVRLPRSVIPIHYNVELKPDLDPAVFRFDGFVDILILCVEDTDNITLHSNKLTLRKNTLRSDDGGGKLDLPKPSFDVPRQFVIFRLNRKLQAGKKYWIRMEFEGELADDLVGLYRSKYTTSTGEVR